MMLKLHLLMLFQLQLVMFLQLHLSILLQLHMLLQLQLSALLQLQYWVIKVAAVALITKQLSTGAVSMKGNQKIFF